MFYVMQTANITEWDKMEYLSFDVLMFGCEMFSGVLLFLILPLDFNVFCPKGIQSYPPPSTDLLQHAEA